MENSKDIRFKKSSNLRKHSSLKPSIIREVKLKTTETALLSFIINFNRAPTTMFTRLIFAYQRFKLL